MSAPALSLAPVRRLETLLLPVPALVRFRDVATGRIVGEGLAAGLRAVEEGGLAVGGATALARSGQGSWCAHRLPGVQQPGIAAPDVAGDSGFFAAPRRPFALAVADALGRMLPLAARVALPQAGPAAWAGWAARDPALLTLFGAAAGQPPAALPLFSAPGRANPGGLVEIRCQLGLAAGGPPPAWVLITATIDGVLHGVGLCDATGAAVIFMPPPPLPTDQLIPPPGFAHLVTLRAHGGRLAADRVPDLADVLDQLDRPAVLLASAAPRALLAPLPLQPGRATVVQTTGGDSRLLMEPAP